MKVLILGCNELTANLVPAMAQYNHKITVLSPDMDRLEQLISEPNVEVIFTAEPLMQDYLLQGGISASDAFLALSGDDHQNALAAQIARHIFNVPRVICYLVNPQLQVFYTGLGLDVIGSSFGLLQDIRQSMER
jgi:trk system potassium uptake protein TrkA